ncbi:MBL fold metallo-hydrolase [Kordiimonas sp.]|uniref:MBL fold metallo-hydrolase n=1 Tax=Kordiimonas sp. TaxID=1970157 RepID=UPI003A93E9BB
MTLKHIIVGLCLAGSTAVSAQNSWEEVEIKPVALNGNVHVIYGAGGNIGVSAGGDGVFIIDDQFAPLTERLKTAIAGISDKPIRFVINTHFHFDHTGGNENLGSAGAVIVAHDNVRQRLTAGSFIKAFNVTTEPKVGPALPVVTFNDQMSLHLNGEDARIIHLPNAHTNSDSIVHFRTSNVIHMGDTFFNGRFPFIDVPNGGTIGGVIKMAELAISAADEQTVVIPGHGQVTDLAGLQAYHDMLVAARDVVAAKKGEGLSLEELVALKPLADVHPEWQQASTDGVDLFVSTIYESL